MLDVDPEPIREASCAVKSRKTGAEDPVVVSKIYPVQPTVMSRGQMHPRFKYMVPWKGAASRTFIFLTTGWWHKQEECLRKMRNCSLHYRLCTEESCK